MRERSLSFPLDNGDKGLERPGIMAFAQPEDGLLADVRVGVRPGDLDERLDTLVLRKLGKREHGLLLDSGVSVLGREIDEGRARLFRSPLSEPEHGLVPDILAFRGPGQVDELPLELEVAGVDVGFCRRCATQGHRGS